jgi:hypothetical protein
MVTIITQANKKTEDVVEGKRNTDRNVCSSSVAGLNAMKICSRTLVFYLRFFFVSKMIFFHFTVKEPVLLLSVGSPENKQKFSFALLLQMVSKFIFTQFHYSHHNFKTHFL